MVASIIDPEDNSFGTWLRSIGGDLISNFCQIYFTYFVLVLCSNSSIQNSLGNDWIGKFAYQTGKSMTASYNDAGGGIDGIKSTGGEFIGGIFGKGKSHSNTNNNNEEGISVNNNYSNFREDHKDSSNHS